MNHTQFYTPLIDMEKLRMELQALELLEEETEELIAIAHSTIHHVIIDAILVRLSPEDTEIFLTNLLLDKHDETLRHLGDAIEEFDKLIDEACSATVDLLLEDVAELREN